MTVWSMLEECVGQLAEPFRRTDIVAWFRQHHPEVKESTLGAHVQAAIETPASRAGDPGTRVPLLRRIDHGLYVRARQPAAVDGRDRAAEALPAVASHIAASDLVLIGCVQTKRPVASPAAELFDSPLFAGRHGYALRAGKRWYILSAKYGLLAPDDVIGPYDVYLADQSAGYRRAWGEFVAAQLDRLEPGLRGRTIEVHAGAAYVDPLRQPFTTRGAIITTPLAHLGLGEQLAWYGRDGAPLPPASPSADSGPPHSALDAAELIHALTDGGQPLSPAALISVAPTRSECLACIPGGSMTSAQPTSQRA